MNLISRYFTYMKYSIKYYFVIWLALLLLIYIGVFVVELIEGSMEFLSSMVFMTLIWSVMLIPILLW